MIKIIRLLAICVALSACGKHSQEAQDNTLGTDKVAGITTENSPLPDGIKPVFSYKVRSKSTAKTPSSEVRKLVIEFKKADARTVDNDLERALVGKGYVRYKTESSSGNLVSKYSKMDHRVTTTTTSAENSKLKLAADSVGTVYFVWH